MEHPKQLKDVNVPLYSPKKENWAVLEQAVFTFCNILLEETQPAPDSFTKQLLDYINEHFTEYELCVVTLKNVFQCSSSKIRKSFKNSMGITINDYIEKKRMDLANELLFQKDMTLAEIAVECGFANANSFYKAYRRIYGHSPSTGEVSNN